MRSMIAGFNVRQYRFKETQTSLVNVILKSFRFLDLARLLMCQVEILVKVEMLLGNIISTFTEKQKQE